MQIFANGKRRLVHVIAWGRVFHEYFQSFHKIARVAKRRGQFGKL